MYILSTYILLNLITEMYKLVFIFRFYFYFSFLGASKSFVSIQKISSLNGVLWTESNLYLTLPTLPIKTFYVVQKDYKENHQDKDRYLSSIIVQVENNWLRQIHLKYNHFKEIPPMM